MTLIIEYSMTYGYAVVMWAIKILLLCTIYVFARCIESDEPVLYYYGTEENERSLPACVERQACSALVQRYWRRAALVRLCRCGRRRRCDAPAAPSRMIELNNRAQLQFCNETTDWDECALQEKSLEVVTTYDRMNPDDLEILHRENIELVPPKITLKCKCRDPNYWKLSSTNDSVRIYQCASLPICRTDEFCGNVSYDFNALYQSCLCPKHHICVHDGGVTRLQISELLYTGRGWKAYCRRLDTDSGDSYEDY